MEASGSKLSSKMMMIMIESLIPNKRGKVSNFKHLLVPPKHSLMNLIAITLSKMLISEGYRKDSKRIVLVFLQSLTR